MAKTYAIRLAELQVIIEKLESGVPEYSASSNAGSRSFKQHDLEMLYEREKFLQMKTDREASGGGLRTTRLFT